MDFFKRYPDEDTCLNHVMEVRYGLASKCPKCERDTTFHKIAKRPAYACKFCGNHVYPCAGTPFEATRTPLQMWFYAIYLFTTTKHGVPAKELQRQLGVTYKTAWRMGHEIRKYMAKVDGDDGLSGHVEIDETYVGGKSDGAGFFVNKKVAVLGMVQRGGEIVAKVIPNNHKTTILPLVEQTVAKGTTVSTDQFRAYQPLNAMGYKHSSVNHSRDEWDRGETHTQTIESFWSRLKASIRGTHVQVSRKQLQKYVGEFEFRFNRRRQTSEQMLAELMAAF
jgi:transposase-like protein